MVDGEDQNCWGNCFEENFNKIFNNEVSQYTYNGVKKKPENVTFSSHHAWFTFEYTESVQDLSNKEITLFDD